MLFPVFHHFRNKHRWNEIYARKNKLLELITLLPLALNKCYLPLIIPGICRLSGSRFRCVAFFFLLLILRTERYQGFNYMREKFPVYQNIYGVVVITINAAWPAFTRRKALLVDRFYP